MPAALVDTGPLVALFVRGDPDHASVTGFLRGFRSRLLTTWPVLTEVCHFLTPEIALRFPRWVDAGGAAAIGVPPEELGDVIRMMEKYADRPMDLADASLVWLAGQSGVREILTLDAGDFATYRTPRGKPFRDLLAVQRASR
ncbi:MAG: PIN domain-containing protein [Betaproteobacteria bacterium]|nr:PIN domain-containing protein [Betaproteobacteria bacterium]